MLNIAMSAARSASDIISRAIYKIDTLNIATKGSNSFVTEIDLLAEQVIIETIRKAYPNHTILAEESGLLKGDDDTTWIIDPLDGTTNYIHGYPQFCVSIGIKRGDVLEHALISDPMRQEIFTASRGRGARVNNRRIRVSKRNRLDSALLGTGFPVKNKRLLKTYLATLEALLNNSSGVRRAGSAALDLAYVAAGRLDGFWEFDLQAWDMAAGVLLIKEAGGLVADFNGAEKYLETGNIIAGNPKIFKALLQTVQPIVTPK